MEYIYGCQMLNTATSGRMPAEFISTHHVHIIVRHGEMSFSDGKNTFRSHANDLVIWQMSNSICRVEYTADFEADFLIVTPEFLQQYNPEMVWASKGFIFIRLHPSFALNEEALALMNSDFALFTQRLSLPDSPFKREVLGRVMQIFLYDMWTVYMHGISNMQTTDSAARLFLRFLWLAQEHARREREVGFYADKLCISAKYLSQVSRTITGLPASQWIHFYATFELITLLNDTTKSLSAICEEMNFNSMSFFSRYTKKNLGKSPSEYRQKE